MNRGDHIVLKCRDYPCLWAIGWHDVHYKCFVTTNGTTLPGPPALKKRQDRKGTNYNINIPRPAIIAKYQQEMGWVDRHNRFRQGILHLPNIWTTRRWQTRIQLEILALTLVDTFLACRKIMPRWQKEGDEEGIFWKFVATLIPQIDPRGKDELSYEDEDDALCATRCHMVRLGQKNTYDGKHRGETRAIQMRCTYCSLRNKRTKTTGRSPLTAWTCSVHNKIYACKHKNCWQDHLAEVYRLKETEIAI
jgi:hypothetical protein